MRRSVALVTGASGGIGAAVATALAKDGADVALQYRSAEAEAFRVAGAVRGTGSSALVLQADLRDSGAVDTLKVQLDAAGWSPDIVVHCAGTAHYGLHEQTGENDWDNLLGVHLKAGYRLARAFGPAMSWRRRGRFVYLSSVWGGVGAAGEAAYAAAKGGVEAFAKSLARELASSGVTVNAVAPGVVETDMLSSLNRSEMDALLREIPLGRLGMPQDVATLIRYLVSDAAGYLTGQVIRIDGGWQP